MSRALPVGLAAVAIAVAWSGARVAVAAQSASARDAEIAKVFARWTAETPGCAVGVSIEGRQVLAKAYGLADLEHSVPLSPDTIFEAGSVSKQFTAAAVLLLARDGKLSLDDQVRKHVPELPDYGVPLTIRHMLNHSSGLRDWGSVAGIAGWPRTTRAYTHAHVLEIVSRQRTLNFPPGTRYSYSNTGYNLAAIIVARVSGMSFAEFTRTRVFAPMGMTHTSWRDDYRRVVKGRAIAYAQTPGGFETLMPFENVHGNGGLLTTVGDLLKWNENFARPVVGDPAFVRELETAGRFNDGRAHGYALGLMLGTRHGLREVAHSGSTAGYRAHLTRFPDARTSVAVLCNVSTGAATDYAESVADIVLAARMTRRPAGRATHVLTAAERDAATGLFRDVSTGEPLSITGAEGGIRVGRGPIFVAASPTRFSSDSGDRWEIDGRGGAQATDAHGTVVRYEKVSGATPSPSDLSELTGTYASDDAETSLAAAVDNGALVLKRRPDAVIRLTPSYRDAFTGAIGTVIFRRDPSGRVNALSVVQDRVWDLRFSRAPSGPTTARPR